MSAGDHTAAGETTTDAIDPRLRIGAVQLAVSDLPRSVDFYSRVLGLPAQQTGEQEAALGPDPLRPALLLSGLGESVPLPVRATGLFHVAWLHPDRASLASTLRRVAGAGWPLEGASDHGVSEALYLSDPDGLGIEIYADRPAERWERPPGGRGVRMVTLPLDLEDLLAQWEDEPTATIAPSSGVGHVHMKVADVPRASSFYRDALGFEEQAQIPSAAFLAAGGYHHHVGLNSWQSRGAEAAPDVAPGLRRIDFELSSPAAVEQLERRLGTVQPDAELSAPENGELLVRDPDGQLLAFAAAR